MGRTGKKGARYAQGRGCGSAQLLEACPVPPSTFACGMLNAFARA